MPPHKCKYSVMKMLIGSFKQLLSVSRVNKVGTTYSFPILQEHDLNYKGLFGWYVTKTITKRLEVGVVSCMEVLNCRPRNDALFLFLKTESFVVRELSLIKACNS